MLYKTRLQSELPNAWDYVGSMILSTFLTQEVS